MAEIRWTLQAADDLEDIAHFIAQDSARYPRQFVADVLDAIEQLAVFPNSGRIVPEVGDPAIREITLGNYRIVHRVQPEAVEILAVWHSARLLGSHMLDG